MPKKQRNVLMPLARLSLVLLAVVPSSAGQSTNGPHPRFTLSVNGTTTAKFYQGWAMVCDGMLSHPNAYSLDTLVSPLAVNALNGSWANTTKLVVTDSNGIPQNWPIQLVTLPPGPLTLDVSNVGRLAWVLSPSDTTNIAPGKYFMHGVLDTTASAGATGWSGVTNSFDVTLQVAPLPTQTNSAQQEEQFELLAMYDHLLGDDSQAVTDLGTLLTQQPNAIDALAMQGDFLEEMGQISQALTAYDRALAVFYSLHPGHLLEAPTSLLSPQQRLRGELLSQSGTRGEPKVAISLLTQGVQSPGVIFIDLNITNIGKDAAANVFIQQFQLQTVGGGGQVVLNNVLTSQLPISVDYLPVNGSATARVYLNVPSTVTSFSLTETGSVADIFGTQSAFTGIQTLTAKGTLLGDLNGDGVVNCADMAIVKASFGKKVGQVGFDPRADVNGDGVVNVLDLSIVARQLPAGTTCP